MIARAALWMASLLATVIAAARSSPRGVRYLLWLLPAAQLCAQDSAPAPSDSLRWFGPAELAAHSDSLSLALGQRQVQLSHPFVLEVQSVRLDARNLEFDLDFDLVKATGLLVLRVAATAGQTLVVRYRFDPLGAPPQRWLHDPARRHIEEPTSDRSADPDPKGAERQRRNSANSAQNLVISGSKTVSVQGGTNREASVDQALRLSVSGKLTEGIDVRAEISDENLPITPEGNTEELSDLDQVRIELSGERGNVLLGDFALRSQPGAFVSYERQLQGLSMRLDDPRGSASVLAGSPRGERVEIEFRGREGVQGPYELLDGARLNQVYIVAGSERVWLDGELMARGENRDYTIDYIRGTVRFTERRPMGPERRGAIDFETTRSGYSRSVVGVGVDSLQAGRVLLSSFLLREADDADRPSDGALSAADRDSLAAAGDQGRAFGGGVVATAPGEGRYDERFGGGGERYFVRADSSGGDFDLFFTRVPIGDGDYVLDRVGLDGLPEFRFVGPGLGDYLLGRSLKAPESLRLFGLRMLAGQQRDAAWFAAEGNFSARDHNQLSRLDDEDNGDLAWRLEGTTGWFGEPTRGVRLSAKAEAIGADFASTGRLRSPFFYERWNLQQEPRLGREGLEEARLLARAADGESQIEVARLHRSQQYDGRRAEWKLTAPFAGGLVYEHGLAFVDAERPVGRGSDRRERSVGLLRRGRLSPHVKAFDERWRDQRAARSIGYRSGGATVGSDVQWLEQFSTRLSFTRELADSLRAAGAGYAFDRDSRRWQGGAVWRQSAWSVNSDAHVRDTRVPGDRFERARLGNLRLSRRAASSSSGFDLSYRAGSDESRVLAREILFVGIGNGDFDAEGQAVGVRQGDYMVVYTPSDSLLRATEVEFQTTVDMGLPAQMLGGHARTLLQVRERNRSSDRSAVLRLSPDLLRNPETTVFGEQRFRQELELLREISGHDLRVSYEERLALDQRFTQGGEASYRRQRELRYELALRARFSLRSEIGDERRRREAPTTNNPLLLSYSVDDRYMGSTLRFRADERRRLSLAARRTEREERRLNFSQDVYEILPRVEAELLAGRITVELRWARIRERDNPSPLRPYFFEAPGTSRRLGISGQWELGAFFTLSARYQLRDEAQRILRHDLALETRARF